jgi:hypothetical protein
LIGHVGETDQDARRLSTSLKGSARSWGPTAVPR